MIVIILVLYFPLSRSCTDLRLSVSQAASPSTASITSTERRFSRWCSTRLSVRRCRPIPFSGQLVLADTWPWRLESLGEGAALHKSPRRPCRGLCLWHRHSFRSRVRHERSRGQHDFFCLHRINNSCDIDRGQMIPMLHESRWFKSGQIISTLSQKYRKSTNQHLTVLSGTIIRLS